MIANVYYSDDMSRAMSGVTYWGIDGRPLSDNLMILINFNSHLSDLAPMPLILACCLIAFSFYMFYKEIFNSEKHFTFLPIAFLFSPFIIEPLSYRFDSLTISASLFFSFAFVSINPKNKICSVVLHSVFIVCLLSLYQPSINISLILISIVMFANISKKKEPLYIIKLIILQIIELIIGVIIYVIVILPSTHVNDNSQNHPGIASNIINRIHKNAIEYYNFYSENILPSHGNVLIVSAFIFSIFLSFILLVRYYKVYKTKASISLVLIAILSIPLTFIASMVSLLVLENSLTTFARVYIGINGLTLFLFSLLYLAIHITKITNAILFVCCLYILTFCYSYGNALHAQDNTNQEIARVIKNSLKDVPSNTVNIMFDGITPKSPILTNSSVNYPLFKTIVLNYFYNWYGSHVYLKIRGVNQNYPDFSSENISIFMNNYCTSTLIYSSNDINIYRDDDNVMVSFDNSLCK
ncbi:glucosyltransferase domain-containing protein [Proteus mirabilis]